MENIGRILLKGIYQESWIKIEYENKKDEITHYMIGIKNIDPFNKKITCDSFNITYSNDVDERKIFFDSILSASICDHTYHKTPQELLDKLVKDKEEFIFLNVLENKEDILDYYIDCFRLDTVPYISKYGLIKGIDNEVLSKEYIYKLSDEQFQILANNCFFQEENKKKNKEKNLEKYDNTLACNILSIKTKKGLYGLAYKELDLDIENKTLRANPKVFINKEFNYSAESNDVKNIDSIHKYLPEEDYYLLDNIENNLSAIINSIHEYNNTRFATYSSEVQTDSRPFIMYMGRKLTVDIANELFGIKNMIANPENMSLPIRTFFGDPESRLAKRLNYPIFTVNDKFNIDQINAINIGLKSPVSYIQGPPGTGKTQTLLNAIVSAQFNGKTVLVTSNNNVPMDGVYESILNLKYRNDMPLLFPAIRLGSFKVCEEAIERIIEMYNIAIKMKPNDSKIDEIKKERKNDMGKLVELLSNYDKYINLKEKKEGLTKLLEETKQDFLTFNIVSQIGVINEELNDLGKVDIDEFKKYMKVDEEYFRYFFMAIHYETASRLQRLKREKYRELFNIIFMEVTDEESKNERTKAFRSYLSINDNLSKFLDIFPVVISTNLSCTFLGKPTPNFDIVMMDEAGQCNVANALIPIVRGKQLMLVGDPQQLKPVILLDKNVNKALRNKYHIAEEYDYYDNSIYTLFTKIDIINNETLLSYHYRCHDKIIGFSNKKYYHNKLKLKGNSDELEPLVFVDTSKEDKNIKSDIRNVSEVEAKYICNFIKDNPTLEIGVITPFVHQKECLEYHFKQNNVEDVTIGTVHAFQGEQKDVIIFSSAITNNTYQSTYEWLKNNRELINVAVSRPKNKLIMLGNLDAINNLSKDKNDLKELADYIKTNGKSDVTDVSISSFALGTRQISTESEKDFKATVEHILSVIDTNCYLKEEVAVSSIFINDHIDSSLFYKQRFDLVIFREGYGTHNVVMAIELNGPEHYTDEEVVMRDKKKKEFCEKKNLAFKSIPRDCARDYYDIKDLLKTIIDVKKK